MKSISVNNNCELQLNGLKHKNAVAVVRLLKRGGRFNNKLTCWIDYESVYSWSEAAVKKTEKGNTTKTKI